MVQAIYGQGGAPKPARLSAQTPYPYNFGQPLSRPSPPPVFQAPPPLQTQSYSTNPPPDYSAYGGPERSYFTGNTLQNFGWPGPVNTANQAAAAAATAASAGPPGSVGVPGPAAPPGGQFDPNGVPTNQDNTGQNGSMATGGRVRRRRVGALNVAAQRGGR